ncbi:MAG: bifunctional 4-hydroxy-2-oxoglutarate aldolase/2-dehydro-3-deoxy-phosphogluconate aldolase [Alphaproteobacteria bacterium]|nr:bifunctional 4-hydroxy-2-oxoglutarate aldolase/2-dehydro-3-deoxy-phosphogluconate aldolase [Alphaproteobacteria bacterium]
MTVRDMLAKARVVPVMTVHDPTEGLELARALVAGGLTMLEVTLRTSQALAAVEAIATVLPEATVGVGTLTRPEEFKAARDAGAVFAVSPGLTPRLAEAGKGSGLAYLPSAITPSEVMAAREWGYTTLKFFPCKAAGGIGALKNFEPVFADVAFCPTGGLGMDDFGDYLALSNVVAAGGTWMMPATLVKAKDWAGITALARQAAR